MRPKAHRGIALSTPGPAIGIGPVGRQPPRLIHLGEQPPDLLALLSAPPSWHL